MLESLIREASRQYQICNACRYCEGFCPVWDAMERRNFFEAKDLKFFSYLCHDCRDCFYACPYSEPHDFSLNIPKLNSTIRYQVHVENSWPKKASVVMDRSYLAGTVIFIIAFFTLISIAYATHGLTSLFGYRSSFYDVIPTYVMDDAGLALGFYILAMWIIQGLKYWREIGGSPSQLFSLKANVYSIYEVLSHKWFKGGGSGCDYPKATGTTMRMYFHGLTFFGFLSAFVATIIAAYLQRILGYMPPYPILSAPVLFGVLGGFMMIIGSLGFLMMKQSSDKTKAYYQMLKADYLVIYLLLFVSITGLLTLALRASDYMGLILVLHLSLVGTLFAVFPFSKMNHIIFRYLSLLKNNTESLQ